jgi:hypothetical protein
VALQICYVLYPGDATEEGKLLRLKQQYTLCSASIQDIIARFKERSGGKVNWDAFPSKVAFLGTKLGKSPKRKLQCSFSWLFFFLS